MSIFNKRERFCTGLIKRSINKLMQFIFLACSCAAFTGFIHADIPPIDIINAVWGRKYTDLFLDYALFVQLCPKNLGCLNASTSRYRIFTTIEDWEYMQAHPSMIKLKQMLPVDFVAISPPPPGSQPFSKMVECHNQAIIDAGQRKAALIFLAPDTLFPNETIETILKKIEQGYRAVLVNPVTVEQDALRSSAIFMHKETMQDNGITPRDLTTFALRHMDKCIDKHWVDLKNGSCERGSLFYKLDNENNLILYAGTIHPIYIMPDNYSSHYDGGIECGYITFACPHPDKWYIVQDSDEMLAVNCSDQGNYQGNCNPPRVPYHPKVVADTFKAMININLWNEYFYILKRPFFIHSTDYKEEWKETIEEARTFTQKVFSYLE